MYAELFWIKLSPMYYSVCGIIEVGSKQGHEHLQQELRVCIYCNFVVADLKTSELFHGPEDSCVVFPCRTQSLEIPESYVQANV